MRTPKTDQFIDGPGLKYLNRKQRWYGGGYCGICGSRDEEELIARAIRFWDPDDGWKAGILCAGCTEEARARGPRPDDYASAVVNDRAARIDASNTLGDSDSTYLENDL